MFSEKMLALGKKSSVIREIFEYSNKRKAQIGSDKVFDFSLGNPSIPAPQIVTDTIKDLLESRDPVSLHGYTSAPGDLNVRKTIAANIRKRFGIEAEFSNIYMTCGAAASLTVSLCALAEPENEVIALAPFFPEYNVFTANAGMKLVPVLCRDGDFQVDIDRLSTAVNNNTKAIIVNSPNNPTGAVLTEESIIKLTEFLSAKEKEYGHPIWILADEPYRELVYNGAVVPYIPNYYNNTIVCYSYSKSLSLPGERIGYIFVSPRATNSSDLFAAVCGAGRSLGFVCAPSMLQYTVGKCDGTPPDLDEYERNRSLLYNGLTEIGYEAVRPDGAFYLFVKALEPDANAFCERAKKYELLVVPSDDFGVKSYFRISYCVSNEQIKRSLPAFRTLFEEYNNKK